MPRTIKLEISLYFRARDKEGDSYLFVAHHNLISERQHLHAKMNLRA